MTKFFVNSGDKPEFTAPAGGVVSGQGYVIGGNAFVVAEDTQPAGSIFTGIREGTMLLTAAAAAVAAEGASAFWDDTAKEVFDASASGRFPIGTFAETRAAAAGRVRVTVEKVQTAAAP